MGGSERSVPKVPCPNTTLSFVSAIMYISSVHSLPYCSTLYFHAKKKFYFLICITKVCVKLCYYIKLWSCLLYHLYCYYCLQSLIVCHNVASSATLPLFLWLLLFWTNYLHASPSPAASIHKVLHSLLCPPYQTQKLIFTPLIPFIAKLLHTKPWCVFPISVATNSSRDEY